MAQLKEGGGSIESCLIPPAQSIQAVNNNTDCLYWSVKVEEYGERHMPKQLCLVLRVADLWLQVRIKHQLNVIP